MIQDNTSTHRNSLTIGRYYALGHAALVAVYILLGFLKYIRRTRQLLLWPEMGIYYQSLLSTCHGNLLAQHIESHWIGQDSISLLGSHAEFIQLIFVPVVYIFRSPEILLLSQLIFLAAGSVFISKYGKIAWNMTPLQQFVFVAAYLFHPYMSLQSHRFHPLAIVVFFQAILLVFLARKSRTGIFLICLLISMCREDTVLFLVPFALFFLVPEPTLRRTGYAVAACSIGISSLGVLVIIPHFAGKLVHCWRYQYLQEFWSDPFSTLGQIPAESFLKYIVFLMLPLLFMPILKWRWTAVAVMAVAATRIKPPLLRSAVLVMTAVLPACFSVLDYEYFYETGQCRANPAVIHLFDIGKVEKYDEIVSLVNSHTGVMSLPSNLIPFALNNPDVHPFPRKLEESELAIFDSYGDYYPYTYQEAENANNQLIKSGKATYRAMGRMIVFEASE